MSRCRAFVYAGIDDFGIAPVEAMASGAPVIALAKGGVLDTVKCFKKKPERATGLLFADQTVKSLVESIEFFKTKKLWKELKPEFIRESANSFSQDSFNLRFEETLNRLWRRHRKSCDIGSSDLRT